jgi:ribonuclease E
MLDTEDGPQILAGSSTQPSTDSGAGPVATVTRRRRTASRPAGPPTVQTPPPSDTQSPEPTGVTSAQQAEKTTKKPMKKTAAAKAASKSPAKKIAAKKTAATKTAPEKTTPEETAPEETTAKKSSTKKSAARKTAAKKAAKKPVKKTAEGAGGSLPGVESADRAAAEPPAAITVLFQPPDPQKATRRPAAKQTAAEPVADDSRDTAGPSADAGQSRDGQEDSEAEGGTRRRRRRGGRRRRKLNGEDAEGDVATADDGTAEAADTSAGQATKSKSSPTAPPSADDESAPDSGDDESTPGSRRRRRRRHRADEDVEPSTDDPADTVVRVRTPRAPKSEIAGLEGSTRLEAKKQRRREGREAGRRRVPIVSEAEFLARRESVERVMVVRQREDVIQIAVLEDKVLVEHYVSRESQTSLIGNVYLGRVQNVLPSMEAAFIDIGKGRNAVLYAGEVNWDLLGKHGQPRKIESVLKSGQSVLVQVSKDPMGHKGARLTSQISLAGRYLVYVPGGGGNGISRKLPDTERTRLKTLLKEILPEEAGVIIRTAAEGTSEEELTRDVNRLTARWEDIEKKAEAGHAPELLYGEPDLTIKVVRDLFTEDFVKLVVSGEDSWDTIHGYVSHVAPELSDRLERWEGDEDLFASYRIDEQIDKALDRKVFLPSGGSVVIDRTEAMTVVDVNTGKFTGSGGNLEETVTKNNLEAAEEIVRQLRVRDIGGIIVVDFIDMVLESNRDLVLRRMVECLGRDRTRHQVAEVTSLGLVQMTRKRIGTGLVEAFSHPCEHCAGRGIIIEHEPISSKSSKPPKQMKQAKQSKSSKSPKQSKPSKSSKSVEPAKSDEADQRSSSDRQASGDLADGDSLQDLGGEVTEPAGSSAGMTDDRRETGADRTPESADTESVGQAARTAAPAHPKSLLDRVEDDLPAAVTPRKRARKRATRPAGQPTPAT